MESPSVSAVLFVKNLKRVADFYSNALGFSCSHRDQEHAVLNCCGFELIVHRIPAQLGSDASVEDPPERRVWAAIRLNLPVRNVQHTRQLASELGGHVDDAPPEWADPKANVFLGHDPEGNVFKISEQVW